VEDQSKIMNSNQKSPDCNQRATWRVSLQEVYSKITW